MKLQDTVQAARVFSVPWRLAFCWQMASNRGNVNKTKFVILSGEKGHWHIQTHDWDLEIRKAVEAADAILICLSESSVSKEGLCSKRNTYCS